MRVPLVLRKRFVVDVTTATNGVSFCRDIALIMNTALSVQITVSVVFLHGIVLTFRKGLTVIVVVVAVTQHVRLEVLNRYVLMSVNFARRLHVV